MIRITADSFDLAMDCESFFRWFDDADDEWRLPIQNTFDIARHFKSDRKWTDLTTGSGKSHFSYPGRALAKRAQAELHELLLKVWKSIWNLNVKSPYIQISKLVLHLQWTNWNEWKLPRHKPTRDVVSYRRIRTVPRQFKKLASCTSMYTH